MSKLSRFKHKDSTPESERGNDNHGFAGQSTPESKTRPLIRGILKKGKINVSNSNSEKERIINIPLLRGETEGFGVLATKYNPMYIPRAKKMSREMTKAECHLWFNLLIQRKLKGYKFTKQKIISHYILDFYCAELFLAIEVDGESHNNTKEYDTIRDEVLAIIGIKTVRISNNNIFYHLENVKDFLETEIAKRKNELLTLSTTV